MRPVVLPPNRLAHFYLGGEAITRLRGVPPPAERSPEEWLGSVTTRHGEQHTGRSALPGGRLLRDAVAADPGAWVGPRPPAGSTGDTGVLVKLLDAGQRLPVHAHPTRAFAARHLASPYGKTEAWYVLETQGLRPRVHVGFRDDVPDAALARAVAEQDVGWLLDRLHAIDVQPGDVVHVPAGTPHAIGEGVFVVEVQEPTDFSVLVEWQGFAAEQDAFLGLDRDVALSAVDHRGWSAADVAAVHRHVPLGDRAVRPMPLLPGAADRFFRADLLAPPPDADVPVDPGFGVLVILRGSGRVTWGERRDDDPGGGHQEVTRGDVLAVPYGAGPWSLTGEATAVLCRPADPAADDPTGSGTADRETARSTRSGSGTAGGGEGS